MGYTILTCHHQLFCRCTSRSATPHGGLSMTPEDRNKAQLQAELDQAQQRISALESLDHKCQIAEAELRQQNKFFHHVIESLTHPFYVLDANDYTIVMANSAARLGN